MGWGGMPIIMDNRGTMAGGDHVVGIAGHGGVMKDEQENHEYRRGAPNL
jgi:hypothetical protein